MWRAKAKRDEDKTADDGSRVGIVVPVYGHSRLVAEAIASALDQDYAGAIDVVVVVDGDRDIETLQTVKSFLSTPGRSVNVI